MLSAEQDLKQKTKKKKLLMSGLSSKCTQLETVILSQDYACLWTCTWAAVDPTLQLCLQSAWNVHTEHHNHI